jgi:hypothetical protein
MQRATQGLNPGMVTNINIYDGGSNMQGATQGGANYLNAAATSGGGGRSSGVGVGMPSSANPQGHLPHSTACTNV